MRILPQKMNKPDYVFALTALALTLFGIVMISSSSMVISFEQYGSNYHYVIRQIGSLVIGLIFMFAAYFIDYRFWKKHSVILFLSTVILLLLVYVPGIGHKAGGSQRWLGIGSFVFQPSEIIKLTFIIYLTAWLDKKGDNIKQFLSGFIPFAILLSFIAFFDYQAAGFRHYGCNYCHRGDDVFCKRRELITSWSWFWLFDWPNFNLN